MTLLKVLSDRTDGKGRNYWDYFLTWRYEGKVYYTRVKNCFINEHKFLHAVAFEVPKGEALEKYVD